MITQVIIKVIYFIPAIFEKIKTFVLRKRLRLNNTIELRQKVFIYGYDKLVIGDYVYLGAGLSIHAQGGVTIGRGTIFGPNVTIYSANHRFREADAIPFDEGVINKEVKIGENCWIGGNVIIVPGTEIGEGCIVGAGAVVSGVIEKYSIVVGNPCKVVGYRDEDDYLRLKGENKIFLKIRKDEINVQTKQ